jgi:hypothetical protein
MFRPLIEMKSKKSCSPCRKLSNGMLHTTFTQGNRVDSQLLVIGSQIANLTPDLYFGRNLCFRCLNESCEPILNIYVSIDFQWYKETFNPIGFNPCNCPLKIQESIGTPIPKMGVRLGVWGFMPSHFFTLLGAWDVIPRLPSWPATLQALALVVSLRLKLWWLFWPIMYNSPFFNVKSFIFLTSLYFYCKNNVPSI